MRARMLPVGCAVLSALMPGLVRAQSVRGTVVDAGGIPVPGVVVRLLAPDSSQAARALTNERGEFTLRAPRTGSYRLHTLRIGYRPVLSDVMALDASAELSPRIELAGIPITLGAVRVAGRSSCGRTVQATATYEALEQVRAALTATELSGASRTIATTGVLYRRTLDAAARRVTGQEAVILSDSGGQPWRPVSTDSLRRIGYVVDDGDSLQYRAPGLETLASDEFVIDHCFRLVRTNDTTRVGISFEPIRERGKVSEVRGTLWVDRASSELRSLDYRYVNVATEITDAGAGGEVAFERLKNGTWVVARWNIRMPLLVLRPAATRQRFAARGPQPPQVIGYNVVGGDLSVVTRAGKDADTLWSRTPLALAGAISDSVSGRPVPEARVSLRGTPLAAMSDARGAYTIAGILPGNYLLEVRTASLDSVNVVHAVPLAFADTGPPLRIRIPNAAQIARSLCRSTATGAGLPGIVMGRVRWVGRDSLPVANAAVTAEWVEGADQEVRWRDGRTDAQGNFRFCGIPVGRTVVVRAGSDSGSAEPVVAAVPASRTLARADLFVDPTIPPTATFAGTVVSDTANPKPVAEAEVLIPSLQKSVRANARGEFRLREIPPGTHQVQVRRLGYGPLDVTLTFAANQTIQRRVVLATVQVLSQVDIVAERVRDPMLMKFEENRKLGLGKFWTRDDLKPLDALKVGSLLESVPSVNVVAGQWLMRRRGVTTLGAGGKFYRIEQLNGRIDSIRAAVCPVTIYVDRKRLFGGGEGEPIPNLRSITVESIEAIEFYSGPASTPAEYSGLNSNCGVLVLHTRRFESIEKPAARRPPR